MPSRSHPGQAPAALPCVIDSIFLLNQRALLATLRARGVKIGAATSVRKAEWEAARIFPPHPASPIQLSDQQLACLSLFAPTPAS